MATASAYVLAYKPYKTAVYEKKNSKQINVFASCEFYELRCMSNEKESATQIMQAFAEAICNGDIHSAGSLLCEKGDFEVQNSKLEIVSAVKAQFISWLALRRLEYPKRNELSYTLSSCQACARINGIIIFNDGNFPYMAWLSGRVSLASIGVRVRDGLIVSAHICLGFSEPNHLSFLDRYIDEVDAMGRENGTGLIKAYKLIFKREYGRSFESEDDH